MGATVRISIAGVLVAVVVLGLGPFLPVPAQGRSHAQNPSCQFTLSIPKLGLFPLIRRLRGDDDIDGNAADVRIEAHLFQPKWRQGEEPQGLKLDLDLQISEVKGNHAHVIELNVAKEDLGKVIGKGGAHASAIRTILAAASGKENKRYILEIVEH